MRFNVNNFLYIQIFLSMELKKKFAHFAYTVDSNGFARVRLQLFNGVQN